MADEYKNLINGERLTEYNQEIEKTYVKQQSGMGLSHNDFTDEMKQKLEKAGESDFSGDYEDLENKPAIDGTELDADSTAAGLGLAKTSDLPGAATSEKAGLVKPDGTTIEVLADGTINANFDGLAKTSELPANATESKAGLAKGDGTTTTTADGVIGVKEGVFVKTEAIADMATNTSVDAKLKEYPKSSEVTSQIDEAKAEMAASKTPCGSIKFANLPTPTKDALGDSYDIEEEFVTNENFLHPNQAFPAGTNVLCVDAKDGTYKWDTIAGFIDYKNIVMKADVTIASSDFIQGLFK